MSFHTPHGSARHRLPWSWTSFDYRTLCEELWEQCDARFEIAKVERRDGRHGHHRPRRRSRAPLIVDALGWRRVLGPGDNVQPPEARISRGLEVHPEGGGVDLDVWIDRSLIRCGYAWSVPGRRRAARRRRLLRAARPRQGADRARSPRRLGVDAGPLPGQLVPARSCARRPRTACSSSATRAGHCFPLSGEGIRTAFYFGIACGPRAARGARRRARPARQALAAYGAFSRRHARAFRMGAALQRAIPAAAAARCSTAAARASSAAAASCARAYGWYLRQADPAVRPRAT